MDVKQQQDGRVLMVSFEQDGGILNLHHRGNHRIVLEGIEGMRHALVVLPDDYGVEDTASSEDSKYVLQAISEPSRLVLKTSALSTEERAVAAHRGSTIRIAASPDVAVHIAGGHLKVTSFDGRLHWEAIGGSTANFSEARLAAAISVGAVDGEHGVARFTERGSVATHLAADVADALRRQFGSEPKRFELLSTPGEQEPFRLVLASVKAGKYFRNWIAPAARASGDAQPACLAGPRDTRLSAISPPTKNALLQVVTGIGSGRAAGAGSFGLT